MKKTIATTFSDIFEKAFYKRVGGSEFSIWNQTLNLGHTSVTTKLQLLDNSALFNENLMNENLRCDWLKT